MRWVLAVILQPLGQLSGGRRERNCKLTFSRQASVFQRTQASRMRFSAYTALLNLPRLIVAMPRKTRIVMKSLAESLPVDAGSVRHFICRYAFVGLDGGEHDVADHLDGGEHDVADHVGGALLD